ncbi:MAG: lipopolysaccharide biosynthesis protein [Pirellulaceae bacterium]
MRNGPRPRNPSGHLPEPSPDARSSRLAVRGAVWTVVATGGQAALQFILLAILSHLLSPDDFGQMASVTVVIGLCTLLAQQGLGPALVQRRMLEPRHIRTGFTLSLLLAFCLTGILWQIAPLVADLFHMPGMVSLIRAVSAVIVLQALSVTAESLLQRRLRLRMLATIDVLSFLVGFGGVAVVLALAGFGVWAIVWAQIAHHALRATLLILANPHAMRPLLDAPAARDLVRVGSGFALAALANGGAHQTDYLVVGRWMGTGALGLYERAYQLMMVPARLSSTIFSRVLFPTMARNQLRTDRLRVIYRRGLVSIALTVLPATVITVMLAPEIVRLLLGIQWLGVVAPLRILAVGMLFRTSYKLSDTLVRATGAAYRRAWRQWIYVLLVAIGALIGVRWGLNGVAGGILLAILVNFLLMAQLSLLLLELRWGTFFRSHLPGIRVAALVAIVLMPLVMLFRVQQAPAILIVALSSLLAVLPVLGAVVVRSRWLLGDDGLWMVDFLWNQGFDCTDRSGVASQARATGSRSGGPCRPGRPAVAAVSVSCWNDGAAARQPVSPSMRDPGGAL